MIFRYKQNQIWENEDLLRRRGTRGRRPCKPELRHRVSVRTVPSSGNEWFFLRGIGDRLWSISKPIWFWGRRLSFLRMPSSLFRWFPSRRERDYNAMKEVMRFVMCSTRPLPCGFYRWEGERKGGGLYPLDLVLSTVEDKFDSDPRACIFSQSETFPCFRDRANFFLFSFWKFSLSFFYSD